MISDELLKILVCPETKQSLRLLSAEETGRLNQAIRAGSVATRSNTPVSEGIDGGLLRDDRALIYPIRDGIPVMLVDEAIPGSAI